MDDFIVLFPIIYCNFLITNGIHILIIPQRVRGFPTLLLSWLRGLREA